MSRPEKVTINIALPVTGAHEVKGSAAWLTPNRVEWTAIAYAGGVRYLWYRCTGHNRDGNPARGEYTDGGDIDTAPSWVPRPPEGWLASLDVLGGAS